MDLSQQRSTTKNRSVEGHSHGAENTHFWPMALCSFFGSLVSLSFTGLWGGPFLMHVYGMSRTQAGGVLSALAIGMIVGAPFMSWLSNRVLHSRKKVLMISQIERTVYFLPLAFFTGNFSETQLYIWCFFL